MRWGVLSEVLPKLLCASAQPDYLVQGGNGAHRMFCSRLPMAALFFFGDTNIAGHLIKDTYLIARLSAECARFIHTL